MHLPMCLVYDKHSRKININIKRELLGPWTCNIKHPKKKGEGERLRQGLRHVPTPVGAKEPSQRHVKKHMCQTLAYPEEACSKECLVFAASSCLEQAVFNLPCKLPLPGIFTGKFPNNR